MSPRLKVIALGGENTGVELEDSEQLWFRGYSGNLPGPAQIMPISVDWGNVGESPAKSDSTRG